MSAATSGTVQLYNCVITVSCVDVQRRVLSTKLYRPGIPYQLSYIFFILSGQLIQGEQGGKKCCCITIRVYLNVTVRKYQETFRKSRSGLFVEEQTGLPN